MCELKTNCKEKIYFATFNQASYPSDLSDHNKVGEMLNHYFWQFNEIAETILEEVL